MDDKVKLKPCPFCGSKMSCSGLIISVFECDNDNCGAIVSFKGKHDVTTKHPIDHFNRRCEEEN